VIANRQHRLDFLPHLAPPVRDGEPQPDDTHEGRAGFDSDLLRLMESANLEERKLVMQAFIARITVQPDEARAATCW
jgi:hypothetical protein